MEIPAQYRAATPDSDIAPLAGPAITIGSTMLVAALLGLPSLPGWADDYGQLLVYFALFLYLWLAARLLWWGIVVWRRDLQTRRRDRVA